MPVFRHPLDKTYHAGQNLDSEAFYKPWDVLNEHTSETRAEVLRREGLCKDLPLDIVRMPMQATYSEVLIHDLTPLKVCVEEVDDTSLLVSVNVLVMSTLRSTGESTYAVTRMTSFSSTISSYRPCPLDFICCRRSILSGMSVVQTDGVTAHARG